MPPPSLPALRPFDLSAAVPWGRHRVEYLAMFDLMGLLGNGGRRLRVLDCAAGPSSFAAEMAELGFQVTACDPLYGSSKAAIAARIEEARSEIMASLRAAEQRFVWDFFKTPEDLEVARLSAMKFFLEDYEDGLEAGRYIEASLPDLPFDDDAFDLALSSHFLLLYSRQFDLDFHIKGILELLRVAPELRIFPLLDLDGLRSAHLPALLPALRDRSLTVEEREVPYEFQRGGRHMLRIARSPDAL